MGRYKWYTQDTGLQAVCVLNYKNSSASSSQARLFLCKHILDDLQRGLLGGGDQSAGQLRSQGDLQALTCRERHQIYKFSSFFTLESATLLIWRHLGT